MKLVLSGLVEKKRILTSSKERKGEIQFQNKRKPGLVGLARVRCPCEKLSATC